MGAVGIDARTAFSPGSKVHMELLLLLLLDSSGLVATGHSSAGVSARAVGKVGEGHLQGHKGERV